MKKKAAAKEPLNPQVRITADILKRLRRYQPVVDKETTMGDVATAALDDYLKKHGA